MVKGERVLPVNVLTNPDGDDNASLDYNIEDGYIDGSRATLGMGRVSGRRGKGSSYTRVLLTRALTHHSSPHRLHYGSTKAQLLEQARISLLKHPNPDGFKREIQQLARRGDGAWEEVLQRVTNEGMKYLRVPISNIGLSRLQGTREYDLTSPVFEGFFSSDCAAIRKIAARLTRQEPSAVYFRNHTGGMTRYSEREFDATGTRYKDLLSFFTADPVYYWIIRAGGTVPLAVSCGEEDEELLVMSLQLPPEVPNGNFERIVSGSARPNGLVRQGKLIFTGSGIKQHADELIDLIKDVCDIANRNPSGLSPSSVLQEGFHRPSDATIRW